MARRKQLKGIAGNLAQWCLSRNFDCEGYWAVGKLYTYAVSKKTDSVCISLKANSIEPVSKDGKFNASIKLLSEVFEKAIESNKIPIEWVKEINVFFKFDTEFVHNYHYFGSASGGKPCICSVHIKTDLGRKYTKSSGYNVWQHNENRERCRNAY